MGLATGFFSSLGTVDADERAAATAARRATLGSSEENDLFSNQVVPIERERERGYIARA